MVDYLYYIFGASSLGIVGFSLLYYQDRNTAEDIIRETSWQFVKTYHRVNLGIENIQNDINNWYNNDDNISEKKEKYDNDTKKKITNKSISLLNTKYDINIENKKKARLNFQVSNLK